MSLPGRLAEALALAEREMEIPREVLEDILQQWAASKGAKSVEEAIAMLPVGTDEALQEIMDAHALDTIAKALGMMEAHFAKRARSARDLEAEQVPRWPAFVFPGPDVCAEIDRAEQCIHSIESFVGVCEDAGFPEQQTRQVRELLQKVRADGDTVDVINLGVAYQWLHSIVDDSSAIVAESKKNRALQQVNSAKRIREDERSRVKELNRELLDKYPVDSERFQKIADQLKMRARRVRYMLTGR